jgi:aspartokinase-like uncharacterized kinase
MHFAFSPEHMPGNPDRSIIEHVAQAIRCTREEQRNQALSRSANHSAAICSMPVTAIMHCMAKVYVFKVRVLRYAPSKGDKTSKQLRQ